MRVPSPHPRPAAAAIALTAAVLTAAVPARADSAGWSWDVSFPQCAGSAAVALPPAPAMGIVGVNGGRPFTSNPCLAAQAAWAGPALAAYINTDAPGPGFRAWPAVTTARTRTGPKRCVAVRRSRATAACAFDYGWKAAHDAVARMRAVLAALAARPGAAGPLPSSPAGMRWWLDVESANWWSRSTALNTASIAGSLAYLRSVRVQSVGIYANRNDANTLFVRNSPTFGSGTLSWLATGATTLTGGLGYCGGPGFTGTGYTWMVQYWPSSLDAEAQCAGAIGGLGTVAAGTPATGLRVSLVVPAAVATTVTLRTSSPGGGFALTGAGPWTPTLTIPVGAGSRQSPAFAYRDTTAGSPAVAATAAGIPGLIGRYGAVVAGPPAVLAITPATTSAIVGSTRVLRLTATDAYGNPVTPGPSARWTAAPSIVGAAQPGPASRTAFRANAVGSATVTAVLGALHAQARVSVTAPPGGGQGAITGSGRLTAGAPSGPLSVRTWAPATAAGPAWTLSSSSATARLALASTGPWGRTVAVTVPVGGVVAPPVYVRDPVAGGSALVATGAAGTITRRLVTTPGAPASLALRPGSVHVRVGGRALLRAVARDAFGNVAPAAGRWSLSRPGVARLLATRGAAAWVVGRTAGSAWVIVRVGSRRAAVHVTVG